VLAAFAVPATAQTVDLAVHRAALACISIANASYRIAAPNERADFTVRLDPAAASPDVRVRLTSSADEADFVLIGDGDGAAPCHGTTSAAKTIRIDPHAPAPDLTVGFASAAAPAAYRIYVRGSAFAPEIAALYAAAQMPARRLGSN
jgi:hypothetical protein